MNRYKVVLDCGIYGESHKGQYANSHREAYELAKSLTLSHKRKHIIGGTVKKMGEKETYSFT